MGTRVQTKHKKLRVKPWSVSWVEEVVSGQASAPADRQGVPPVVSQQVITVDNRTTHQWAYRQAGHK